MNSDPGLRFWLSFVEHSGGLVEAQAGSALAVLPDPLQARLGLPETISVTGDPEIAREDDALLLAAGHPVLDLAAEAVLAAADVGRHALAWPKDELPDAGGLLDRARGVIGVDHGRIDLADAPIRSYLPVIRAGAMIRYTVAGDEAFQEKVECWLDAGSRRELPEHDRLVLEASVPVAPDGARVLPCDVGRAVDAVHDLLSRRAQARLTVLDADGEHARAVEVSRTTAYYRDVLAGIERRRAGAAPERRVALDARAEATRAEQARRLAEIGDKHRARLDVTPYRLHLVLVPAVVLPVDVLRGSRRYPLRLVWVWPAGHFRAIGCPSCGAEQPLVAGKAGLGCRACLTRPAVPPAPAVPTAPGAAKAPAVSPSVSQRPTGSPQPAGSPPAPVPAQPRRAPTPPVARPAVTPVARPGATQGVLPLPDPPRPSNARLQAMGDDLALSFWQAVADGDRHLVKRLLPDSPAAAVRRLFGVRGLVGALGIGANARLESVSGGTRIPGPLDRFVSEGTLRVRQPRPVDYPMALVWRLRNGRPAVDEILPYASRDPAMLPRAWFMTPADWSPEHLPRPAAGLDPVAAALVDDVLPAEGMPLLARCLAAWWRVDPAAVLTSGPPNVLAAAVLRLVSWRSGHRLSTAECAERFAVTTAQIKDAESRLQACLRLSETTRW